jgi:hypothetical protein
VHRQSTAFLLRDPFAPILAPRRLPLFRSLFYATTLPPSRSTRIEVLLGRLLKIPGQRLRVWLPHCEQAKEGTIRSPTLIQGDSAKGHLWSLS